MDNYHRKNLLDAYHRFVVLCIASVTGMTLLTVYTVHASYSRLREVGRNTYVFSTNGASIHVFIPNNQNGRITETAKTL